MARIWGITSLDKLEFESRHLSTAAIPNFSAVQHTRFCCVCATHASIANFAFTGSQKTLKPDTMYHDVNAE